METAPTSIGVILRLTLGELDEPSDLRGFLSPTTRHRCTHVLVYKTPGVCQVVTHTIMYNARRCSDRTDTDELTPYPVTYVNPFRPEFNIVIFIQYKPRIALAILDL